jgi:hypothetical protein
MIPHPSPLETSVRQEFEIHLRLSESEARVLWALFCYGHEPVMKAALQSGTHYMKLVPNYEAVFESLGRKAYNQMERQLDRIDATRKTFEEFGKAKTP